MSDIGNSGTTLNPMRLTDFVKFNNVSKTLSGNLECTNQIVPINAKEARFQAINEFEKNAILEKSALDAFVPEHEFLFRNYKPKDETFHFFKFRTLARNTCNTDRR